MAALTIQTINGTAAAITTTSASSGGDTWANTGSEFLYIKNGGGEAVTVTITAQITSVESTTYGTLTKSDVTTSVAAGTSVVLGGFSTASFNDTNGEANITYSGVTSVTVGVLITDTKN